MATKCQCQTTDIFVRDVRVIVPSVTDDMVRLELFNCVRDFCLQSLAVRADTLDTIAAGSDGVVLADTDDGMEVVKVISLSTTNGRLRPIPALRLSQSPAPSAPVNGLAGYWCDAPNSVRVWAPPVIDVDIAGVVAVAPKVNCAENFMKVPEVLYQQHYEAIRCGTLGRLYMQLGKPYSNMPQARLMMGRANARSIQARITADQSDTMGEPPWTFPRGFVR